MIHRALILIAAGALLAACQTFPGANQQGYAQGTSASGTGTYSYARSKPYTNKANGNCGHCMGNTGR